MLCLMTFDFGLTGDRYQEVVDGNVVRWFDLDGNVIELPASCGYHLKDAEPEVPAWYQGPGL